MLTLLKWQGRLSTVYVVCFSSHHIVLIRPLHADGTISRAESNGNLQCSCGVRNPRSSEGNALLMLHFIRTRMKDNIVTVTASTVCVYRQTSLRHETRRNFYCLRCSSLFMDSRTILAWLGTTSCRHFSSYAHTLEYQLVSRLERGMLDFRSLLYVAVPCTSQQLRFAVLRISVVPTDIYCSTWSEFWPCYEMLRLYIIQHSRKLHPSRKIEFPTWWGRVVIFETETFATWK